MKMRMRESDEKAACAVSMNSVCKSYVNYAHEY